MTGMNTFIVNENTIFGIDNRKMLIYVKINKLFMQVYFDIIETTELKFENQFMLLSYFVKKLILCFMKSSLYKNIWKIVQKSEISILCFTI